MRRLGILVVFFFSCISGWAQTLPPGVRMQVVVRQYDAAYNNAVLVTYQKDLNGAVDSIQAGSAVIGFATVSDQKNGNARVGIKILAGSLQAANIAIRYTVSGWADSNYVLAPGALYNGNKFDFRRIAYSPKLLDPKDIGPEKPQIIGDIPRLTKGPLPSRVEMRSGAMAYPCISLYDRRAKIGYSITSPQGNSYGDYGYEIAESADRSEISLTLESPLVRERYKYRITDAQFPSTDKPTDFKAGDTLYFRLNFQSFSAQSLPDFIKEINLLREHGGLPHASPPPTLPFSLCFAEQEKKFNGDNWQDSAGYYAVGMRENFLQDWQIGWTGGMISTYPLLVLGDSLSRKRVTCNYDWLFANGISPSGYFYDAGVKGRIWYGGDIRKPTSANWHLVRKSSDGLFYALKQFEACNKVGITVKPLWANGARKVADAMLRTWYKFHQLGQFVNSTTGDVEVGGSASAALAPAALALAAQYYHQPEYLAVAEELAAQLYHTQLQREVMSGGPGDALQAPDSESAYSFLESLILLYEQTGQKKYLTWAQEAAEHFITWVCPYDYAFPPNSLFGKIGIHSAGAVLANAQNTHGAPGICTFSGSALLRLYKHTGEKRYAETLALITRGLPQYLGHPARPIPGVKDGWMCERVSMTDWLEGIGEITYQSTWAETALMLTTMEIPSVYIDEVRKTHFVFDQLITERKGNTLTLTNPAKQAVRINIARFTKGGEKVEKVMLAPSGSTTIRL